MKRILLACCIVIASCTVAMAQQTGPVNAPTQIDPKTWFSSAVSKYDAGISRNNTTMAQAGFAEAMTTISGSIASLNQQLNSSAPINKQAVTAKMQQQQQIYTDLQALQSNIVGNAVSIKSKFTAFQAIM